MQRKAAGTMRVVATGRASHSGSAPDQGRNALLALAATAIEIAKHHDPGGAERLSVVPTVVRSGDAFNVVPADGELLFDMRADRSEAFDAGVRGRARRARRRRPSTLPMQRIWPGMDSREATRGLLERASARLGRPIVGVSRGGRERRQPLRAEHPAHRRRARPARRRRPHSRGVRARPVVPPACRGGAGACGRGARAGPPRRRAPGFLVEPSSVRLGTCDPLPCEHEHPNPSSDSEPSERGQGPAPARGGGRAGGNHRVHVADRGDQHAGLQPPRQRRHPGPATSTTSGASSPPRSSTQLAAPDREHDPVRVHGSDHRAARRARFSR